MNKFPSKQSHSFRGGKNCVPHFRAGGNQKAYKIRKKTIDSAYVGGITKPTSVRDSTIERVVAATVSESHTL